MAAFTLAKIKEKGASKSPEWWAQAATVAYEQHIGRRQPGQQSSGLFSVTVSKTLEGTMDKALASWLEKVKSAKDFHGVAFTEPRQSQTDKWRYWRCTIADGSTVSVNIQTKPNGEKSIVSVNHDKLRTAADVETWRVFWKNFLS